ncbi:putative immunity protein [Propionibacterium freudenreichii]|uniref:putative immunity protein n=1 Tax=Propionibacterium freudenreichii TaxID=1744 RepID=UPI0038542357
MILSKVRDPRLITIRRGGSLTDEHHRLLTLWAARCAEHVLPLFEKVCPDDLRPRLAIDAARTWVRGDMKMMQARAVGGHSMGAARPLRGAARFAAYAAGQAACVPHVAEHDLGAAAYAIKAVQTAATPEKAELARIRERDWQRDQLPPEIRDLVLEDQQRRNDICWHVFSPRQTPTPTPRTGGTAPNDWFTSQSRTTDKDRSHRL